MKIQKTTADQVQQFKQDGYLIVRGVFNDTELARLRQLAGDIQERTRRNLYSGTRYWGGKTQDPKSIPAEQRGLATWGINEITRRELFHPELVNVFAHPSVNETMNALLDQPRAWGIKILWTPKLISYNLGWHRDQMKQDLYDYVHYKPEAQDHVQFNAALNFDDCFLVIPGSHRRPLTDVEWNALKNDRTADLPGQVVAVLNPGDILYMDAHTLHRGRSDVNGNRLTLHYSAQAQWVSLNPWGEPEDFAFITSDEFISQLHPDAQPYYLRLRTAKRTPQPIDFLLDAAEKHGWKRTEAYAKAME